MKILLVTFICMSVFISCKTTEDPKPQMSVTLQEAIESPHPPEHAQSLKMGSFSSFAHNLSGSSTLYLDSLNNKILRFEDYTMSQGPDVYIFLSKSNNYSNANVIKIAKLTEDYSNISLSVNIDSYIDINTYKFVLVYCVQYNSLFGYTELK